MSPLRIGVVLLPEQDWERDRRRWRRAEDYGFDNAWLFDHLAWRELADKPWHATIPTLVAAALETSKIRIGPLVATPNFRHPVPFAKELMTLDVISGGRLTLALGAGAPGFDAAVLGQVELTQPQRQERFAEFLTLLAAQLANTEVSCSGQWYDAVAARTHPGTVQRPRPPMLFAANGSRGLRVVATSVQHPGDGWVTVGPRNSKTPDEQWWSSVTATVQKMDAVCAALADERQQPVASFDRLLYLGARTSQMTSIEQVRHHVGRAVELGFTDVALVWPRADGPLAGRESVLDEIADDLPRLRGTSTEDRIPAQHSGV